MAALLIGAEASLGFFPAGSSPPVTTAVPSQLCCSSLDGGLVLLEDFVGLKGVCKVIFQHTD